MLGEKYEVKNFGFSGATMLKKGHKPYWIQSQYYDALAFKPQIVIIHLGLNDTDPRNWPNYHDEFIPDYESLIKIFKEIDVIPKPKVWICRMTPIFSWHSRFQNGTRDYFWAIQDAIKKVSESQNVTLIDLHSQLDFRSDLFRDAVHPSEDGARIIAETIRSSITGYYGGLSLPEVFSDHMVIQRRKPIQIYGTADAGMPIEVTLANVSKKSISGLDGKWKVEFPAMEAGGPYIMSVKGDKLIYINDILIGEVWVCSGQSNMAFKLKDSENAIVDLPMISEPQLRLFNLRPAILPDNSVFSQEDLNKINRGEYFTGGIWSICNPESAADFSAVAYYFGSRLVKELNVPVGLIHNAVGGSNTESWIWRKDLEFDSASVSMLTNWLHNELVQKWCRDRAVINLSAATNPLQRHPYEPGYLYQAGILPLTAYPIRGVIWYQGESNAEKTLQHEVLFKLLVKGWREAWKDPVMPFLYVQLSSLNREGWPLFRDSQRRLMGQIPVTGMAVTSDIGNFTDVHPKNKKDVGERIARWALALEYGRDIVPSGPLFKSIKISNNKIIVIFDYATDKLKTSDGKPLRGFEIASNDEIYSEAHAKISKNRVIVYHKKSLDPFFLRYGWKPFTDANLTNREGLPASTFKTQRQ
jgi:sialate O-acetylesterase